MDKTEQLLQKLQERIAAAPPKRRNSRPPPAEMGSAVWRFSQIRLIKSLIRAHRAYGFQVLLDQATLGHSDLRDLSDDELVDLHRTIDKARECVHNDISFEDAGLIKSSCQSKE